MPDADHGQWLLERAVAGRGGKQVVELALTLSLGAIIEPALLRSARREVVHSTDAGLESDLWFGPLVATRNATGMTLEPDALVVLRRQLAEETDPGFVALARSVVERAHRRHSPAVRLEEQVIWEAVRPDTDTALDDIDVALRAAVRAMKLDDNDGRAAARWAAHAWRRLPEEITQTEAGQLLAAGVSQRLGDTGLLTTGAMPPNVGWLAPKRWRGDPVEVGLEVTVDTLRFVEPGTRVIQAPPTRPVMVEVSWSDGAEPQTRLVEAAVGTEVALGTTIGPITIRTLDGARHTLEPRGGSVPSPDARERAAERLAAACAPVAGRRVAYQVAPGWFATTEALDAPDLDIDLLRVGSVRTIHRGVAILSVEGETSFEVLEPDPGIVMADGASWMSYSYRSGSEGELVTGSLDGRRLVMDASAPWSGVFAGAPVLVEGRLAGQVARSDNAEPELVPVSAVAQALALTLADPEQSTTVYIGRTVDTDQRALAPLLDVVAQYGYSPLFPSFTERADAPSREMLRMLARCDAAVLPITRKTEESTRTQLDVLRWRQSLNPELTVILLLLDGSSVRAKDTEIVVSSSDRTKLEAQLARVAHRRDQLLPLIVRVDQLLVQAPDTASSDDQLAAVVRRLTTGGPEAVTELVAEFMPGLSAPAAKRLASTAALLNLSPVAAGVIRDAVEDLSKPALYLATSSWRVAELYVEFAWIDTVAPAVQVFENYESIFGRFDEIGIWLEGVSGPAIAILDIPASHLADVEGLRREFPALTVLIAGRGRLDADRSVAEGVRVVEPVVGPAHERAALRVASMRVPATSLRPTGDDDLLARHVPLLRYDSQERFFACSVATMTDNVGEDGHGNALHRADGTVIATAGGRPALSLGFLRAHRYSTGDAVRPDDYISTAPKTLLADARRHHADPGYADRVYGRAARTGEQLFLQYWLFYYHDDHSVLGSGEHEGDWELIQIRMTSDGAPLDVALSHRAGVTVSAWSEFEHTGPDTPVVYVARGSHSNHAVPGTHGGLMARDRADGRGPVVQPVLERFGEQWAAWPGFWGATKGFPRQSPRGPRFHRAWNEPVVHHAGQANA